MTSKEEISEIGTEYKITRADYEQLEPRIFQKLSATTFTWTFTTNRVHQFDPLYKGLIKVVDYPNNLIQTDRETAYNLGEILTDKEVVVSDGTSAVITGSFTGSSINNLVVDRTSKGTLNI